MRNDRWDRDSAGIEVFDVEPAPARPRAAGRAGKRQRGGGNWRPLSLIVVAVLAAVAVSALADSPTAVPIASPATADATPVATPDVPAATTGPALSGLDASWQGRIGLPVVTVSTDVARVATRDGPFSWTSPAGPESGPFLYVVTDVTGDFGVLDVGRGAQAALPVPLKRGEKLAGVLTDGTWLAVEVAEADKTCGPTMPWRLLVAPVGHDGLPTGGATAFSQVASGIAVGRKVPDQVDCLVTRPPLFDLVAGRLAWVEEPSGNRGSVVRVRTLDGGRTATYTSTQYAVELALSADAVAWVESPDPAAWRTQAPSPPSDAAYTRPNWQVMDVGPADTAPQSVSVGVSGMTETAPMPSIVLNGATVVATLHSQDLSPQVIVVAGDVRLQVIDDASLGRFCSAQGASDGVVLLACEWPGVPADSADLGTVLSLGATWTPSSGLRAISVGGKPTPAYGVRATPGWALLMSQETWTAIPMSALTAP